KREKHWCRRGGHWCRRGGHWCKREKHWCRRIRGNSAVYQRTGGTYPCYYYKNLIDAGIMDPLGNLLPEPWKLRLDLHRNGALTDA
ncbi:hypothetical protein KKD52_15040, partial [Myxococcota bacterium]|nr:hypothetical protein [Myxococcota bacterium]